MNESILREYYATRGFSNAQADRAVFSVSTLERWLSERGASLETAAIETIRLSIRGLIDAEENDLETLLAQARYFYLIGRNEIYVYFTSLLGGLGVIESIQERLGDLAGCETKERLLGSISPPPLGSEPVDFPEFTKSLMSKLETALPELTVQRVLAGNHHGIPPSVFDEDAQLYRNASSMEEYLSAHHERQVFELQRHCDANTVWYEQIITQAVVDFVAANPEIQSAVLRGDTLYTTKIPYDPASYLAEADPVRKRYYACHCPFVREAILRGETDISPNWCYCSGGFVKHPFEVILGRELRVTLLKSVLKGDAICRFAIHLDGASAK